MTATASSATFLSSTSRQLTVTLSSTVTHRTVFSGIGNPDSFKKLLLKNKFKIIEEITFPDHYNYRDKDILEIITKANSNSAEIITTEKDFKRIPQNFKEKISFLEIDMKIKDENKLVQFLKTKINEIN